MISITARAKTRIWGTRNAWSLSLIPGPDAPNRECEVAIEIQGDDRDGYHLVMSPSGFFTADYWYQTMQEALDAAEELFGVCHDKWSKTSRTGRDSE
jgi:hypothetical protein